MRIWQDIHFGARQLRNNPAFAITSILTLALAIGVTTAIFSVLYAVMIRPLPYRDADKIVYLQGYSPQGYTQPMSYPEYLSIRQQNQSFSAVAAFQNGTLNMEGPTGPTPVQSVRGTDNLFDVLGVPAMIGRTFAAGEEVEGQDKVAVLSYEIWQEQFGKEKSAVGST